MARPRLPAPVMPQLAAKLAGLAVLLVVILGGTYLARESGIGGAPVALPVDIAVAAAPSGIAPGSQATFAVLLTSASDEAIEVALTVRAPPGFGADAPRNVSLRPRGAVGLFVTLRAGEESGPASILLEASSGKARAGRALALTVGAGGEVAEENGSVRIHLTGRLANGSVFWSTASAIQDSPAFAKAGFYSPNFPRDPVPLSLAASPGVPEGLWRGIVGMRVGESRSYPVPAERAFGAGTITQAIPRNETIPRESQVAVGGLAEGATLGSAVANPSFPALGTRWTVSRLEGGSATLRLDVTEGERVTWFPFLPDHTVVGRVADDVVDLVHSPPEGFTFPVPGYACAGVLTVEEVTPDLLVVRFPPHPLCGVGVIFDVTLVGFEARR